MVEPHNRFIVVALHNPIKSLRKITLRKKSPCTLNMSVSGDYRQCSSAKQNGCQTDASLFPWDLCQFRECARINNVVNSPGCDGATGTSVVGELSGQLSLLFNVCEMVQTLKRAALRYP